VHLRLAKNLLKLERNRLTGGVIEGMVCLGSWIDTGVMTTAE
jgi:hypothetical protein